MNTRRTVFAVLLAVATTLRLAAGTASYQGRSAAPAGPFTSITGTVLDEFGEPVVGVVVRALRLTTTNGKLRSMLAGVAQARTDDRGVYRLSPLVAGDYFVAVPSTVMTVPIEVTRQYARTENLELLIPIRPNGAGAAPPSVTSDDQRVGDSVLRRRQSSPVPPKYPGDVLGTYRTTFYPTATSSFAATTISLKAGEAKTGIDIRLKPEKTARISGRLVGPDNQDEPALLRLFVENEDDLAAMLGLETASALSDDRGAFTILGVPPGRYVIKASRNIHGLVQGQGFAKVETLVDKAWANQPIAIGDTDVVDLAVPLHAGLKITGTVAFESATLPSPADRNRVSVNTYADTGAPTSMFVSFAPPSLDGVFSRTGLIGGHYFVSVATISGWFLKSIRLGDRDLIDRPIDLKDKDVSGIVVTLTDVSTELSGTVRTTQGAADSDAAVLLFTSDSTIWGDRPPSPLRLRFARTDAAGTFALTKLVAGEYYVVAVPAASSDNWLDPKRLEQFSRLATKIVIANGGKPALELTTKAGAIAFDARF